jgi:signal transduction histidine kinase
LANERGIGFVFVDNSDSAFVIAEPDRLFRAFGNLIDNAIKFSPDNGKIAITLEQQDARIAVSITDEGVGIAPDILPRLFSRFASGGDQKGRIGGIGLGLTFVRAVIERHGGQVIVGNTKGQGATFTVCLPEVP